MRNQDTNIRELSKAFALRIINLYKYLTQQATEKEFVMSKQVLRSGTSIGANIREAVNAQSKAEFGSKMSIALKEAAETEYWLELLHESEYITEEAAESILSDCKDLYRILSSIVKTTFESIKK